MMGKFFPRRHDVCDDFYELEGGFEPMPKKARTKSSEKVEPGVFAADRMVAVLHKVLCLYLQRCSDPVYGRMDFQGAHLSGVVLEIGIAVTEADLPAAGRAWQQMAPVLRRDLARMVRRKKVPVLRAVWLLQLEEPMKAGGADEAG